MTSQIVVCTASQGRPDEVDQPYRPCSRQFAVAKNDDMRETASQESVESAMVRHHYGPWDKRYYHVLAYLEAKQLITIAKSRNSYQITLTDRGKEKAAALMKKASFALLVERMRAVKKEFGSKSGNTLKKLIYQLFDEEVGKKPLGEVIRR
jgi:DNA-binding PadR family transcriptional regulator